MAEVHDDEVAQQGAAASVNVSVSQVVGKGLRQEQE